MTTLVLSKKPRFVDVSGGTGSASSLNLLAPPSSRTPS